MRIQASRVKARRRTVRLLVFLQTVLSDFPLRMQLLLSAVHADGLRRCPSSDLLIQSGWVSHHKTFRVFSRRLFLTFWQSAQPMETLRFIYIRWLASSPNSQTVAVKSVWEMRMRSPLSASAEWQKSWSGASYFLSLFSHFLYQKSFFLQAESFTIPTRSCQSKHQLQEKFLWNAIKEIPPRQREREKGVWGAVWNGEWRSLPPFLPPSLSLLLCHAVIPPYLSWQERNSAAVWEHSQSLHGSKRRENATGSLPFMHCKHTLHYLVSCRGEYDNHSDTHKKNNDVYLRVNIIHTHKDISSKLH